MKKYVMMVALGLVISTSAQAGPQEEWDACVSELRSKFVPKEPFYQKAFTKALEREDFQDAASILRSKGVSSKAAIYGGIKEIIISLIGKNYDLVEGLAPLTGNLQRELASEEGALVKCKCGCLYLAVQGCYQERSAPGK